MSPISTAFDVGPLTWVKPEIDVSLKQAATTLEAFGNAPGDKTPLRNAATHLHQVTGALSMVGLQGLARFCEALEQLSGALHKGDVPAAGATVARRAIKALSASLEELLAGEPASPLSLFPLYRELRATRGETATAETDLFFPDLSVALPSPLSGATPLAGETLAALFTEKRIQFQRGLVRWLRGPGDVDSIRSMAASVNAAEAALPASQERALWWVAQAFLECLHKPLPGSELVTKQLCARLDLHLKHQAEGSSKGTESLLRDLLYYVARHPASGGRIGEVKSLYRLEGLLPVQGDARAAIDSVVARPVLREAKDLLLQLKEGWNKMSTGNRSAGAEFLQKTQQLAALMAKQPVAELGRLAACIREVALALTRQTMPVGDAMALEMAAALLFMDNALDNYARLNTGLKAQVDMLIRRMTAVYQGKAPSEGDHAAFLDEISRRAQERLLMHQVGEEIQTNLNHIEQVLDGFFRDPAKRPELATIGTHINQVQGALAILEAADAGRLLAAAHKMINAFVSGSDAVPIQEAELVAEALSNLGLYVRAVQRDQANREAILHPVLIRFGLMPPPPTTPAAATTPIPAPIPAPVSAQEPSGATVAPQTEPLPAVAPPSHGAQMVSAVSAVDAGASEVDAELLAVFLEEATEVLTAIADNGAICRQQPADKEVLTTIRRGFHTLKGSGRMVGLTDLGEVAWQVEQVMNKWLGDDKPASPELLRLIDLAHQAFSTWVEALKTNGRADVQGQEIVALAEQLKNGQEPVGLPASAALPAHETTLAAEPQMKVTPAAAVAEMPVRIGVVSLDPGFFAIFIAEAEQHAQALRTCLTATQANPAAVLPYDFMRAAHTLASIARTTGFDHVADLGHALELWLHDRVAFPLAVTPENDKVLDGAISALAEMLVNIRERINPPPRPDMVGQLENMLAEARAGREQAPPVRADMADVPVSTDAALEPERNPAPEPEVGLLDNTKVPAGPLDAIAEPAPDSILPELPRQPEAVTPVDAEMQAGPQLVEAGKDRRMLVDDLDEQLLPVFLEEAFEILPQLGAALRAWEQDPANAEWPQALHRYLHTLKGSARMAGVMRLGELAHVLENRIIRLADGSEAPTAEAFNGLQEDVDRFNAAMERLKAGQMEEQPGGVGVKPAEATAASTAVQQSRAVRPARPAEATRVSRPADATRVIKPVAKPALRSQMVEPQRAVLRVAAEVVDRLVNEAGELAIARSRIEGEVAAFKQGFAELADSVTRLRAQLREIEIQAESQIQSSIEHQQEIGETFDPLEFDRFTRMQELTRFMAESVNDFTTVHQSLRKNIDEIDAALTAQSRLNRDVQKELMAVRMIPLANLSDRLHRVVRQTAKDLHKKANLELRGMGTELDRSVLEKIVAPLEHLLRNAVFHGLEAPEQRAAAGKPEIGEIVIEASQQGNEVALTLSDDGAGLNFSRIHAKAVQAGLMASDAQPTEPQLADCIFLPGFSTATEVSEVAGRGVGMDVVRNEIMSLGGRVELSSLTGKGTVFTILLPLTLAVTQGVLVRAADGLYAIPSSMVEQVQEQKIDGIKRVRSQLELEWQDHRYAFYRLGTLLGGQEPVDDKKYYPILLLRSGMQRVAIEVDAIVGNREIVVKPIGPQLSRLAGVAGATVLGNGQVILILNPAQLAAAGRASATESRAAKPAVVKPEELAPLVMIVDDSLTVRKITSRLMLREGYRVMAAKDGVDALEQLRETIPDVMLLDIEMPRMDGFEVTRNVRADSRTASIPIIMITSRTADKHRNFAKELGVNEYLGKPFQEDDLLARVAQYAGQASVH